MKRPIRPWAPRDLLALSVAGLVHLALAAAFWDRFWYPPDEGAYASVAARMLDGEGLNREVADIHTGAINFVHAAAMMVFGRSLLALRYPLMVAALGQGVVVFLLFRRHGPWLAALPSVAILPLSVLQYLDPSAHWYCLPLFFAVCLELERPPTAGRCRSVILGLLVGLVFLFRQLTAVFVAMGMLAYLLAGDEAESVRARRTRPLVAQVTYAVLAVGLIGYLATTTGLSGFVLFGLGPLLLLVAGMLRTSVHDKAVLRLIGGLATGFVIPLLPLLAFHAMQGSLGSWYDDVVHSALAHSRMPFREHSTIANLAGSSLATALRARSLAEAINGVYWLFLTLSAASLGATSGFRSLCQQNRGRLAPLPFLACFYGLVTLHFQNSTYLHFGVGATVLGLYRLLVGDHGGSTRAAATGLAALALVATWFHAGQSLNRGLGGLLTGQRLPVEPATGLPHCGLRLDRQDIAVYSRALALIDAHVTPGQTFLVLPFNPELYFLSSRVSPVRYFNYGFGLQREADVAALLSRLRQNPPPLIFFSPDDKYNTPLVELLFIGLAGNYRLIEHLGPWVVMGDANGSVAP